MKILPILLMAASLPVCATGWSQNVSLRVEQAHPREVIKQLEKQTGYRFIYGSHLMEGSKPITIQADNQPLEKVLLQCFKEQPFGFEIDPPFVILSPIAQKKTPTNQAILGGIDIKGRVVDENGEPIEGVSVSVKGANIIAVTDRNGQFQLTELPENSILIFTGAEFESKELRLSGAGEVYVKLKRKESVLEETVVIGYGETKRRLTTSNVSTVKQKDIANQPVTNVINALHGRVPGMLVTQTSGQNGSGTRIQIRGKNSLIQGSEPLYIIDGVPFSIGNSNLNSIGNAAGAGGLSPFELLNPGDISSVTVLKDADATAIYGSRGANGVILITTKNGKVSEPTLQASYTQGWSKATRLMDFLDTREYLLMREEAFANDGLAPSHLPGTSAFAPDITRWDINRYTNLSKLLIGGTARSGTAQISYSGGGSQTRYLISASYNRNTTVMPSDLGNNRVTSLISLQHQSLDGKFALQLVTNYAHAKNNLTTNDLTSYIRYAPNILLYDSSGKLNWQENGITFRSLGLTNPLAELLIRYEGKFQNLNGNLQLSYLLAKGLKIKASLGYNTVNTFELGRNPKAAIDPYSTMQPYAQFSDGSTTSWIVEPQINYEGTAKNLEYSILLGSTIQESESRNISITALNYSNDALLGSLSGAGQIYSNNSYAQYRYLAGFARVSATYRNQVLVNFSGRRDGSSRFAPENRFANFAAIGAGWLFSSNSKISKTLSFLTHGKLRVSYGIVGNDQIPDYRYLPTWTSSSNAYQGQSSLSPSSLYNPHYGWERNRKWEAGLDIGILRDRLFLSVSYFRNRSDNQLINYTLPVQTGFNSVLRNLDAKILNEGIELELVSKNVTNQKINWTTTLTLTRSSNKLLSFPGLEKTSYASRFIIGESLASQRFWKFQGVNPESGVYEFLDINGDNKYDLNDRTVIINPDPRFFGGIQNDFSIGSFSLMLFLEFRSQIGLNYLNNLRTPGFGLVNQPDFVLNRWNSIGDQTSIQRYTATTSSVAFSRGSNLLLGSDGIYSDASFLRCKTLAIAYSIPAKALSKLKLRQTKIFAQAQNLFVITNYKGADPEVQNVYILPPMRTISAGIQIIL